MVCKNIIPICLLFLLLTSFVVPNGLNNTAAQKWVISESSTLSVNGSTNINNFACEIPNYDRTDTLIITKKKGVKDIALTGNVSLNVKTFDCHNPMMTSDLRKTLNVKQYPTLNINFLSLNDFPEMTARPQVLTGLVDIELAGTRKRFEVNYQVSVDAQRTIHLLGTRDVNFSDFNLIPPKKLGGLIKTNDKLSVSFHLKIKAID
jgi:hypothetical protein